MMPSFCGALNRLAPGWTLGDDAIVGPLDARVQLCQRRSLDSPGHSDVEFTIYTRHGQPVSFWDCVSATGDSLQEMAELAAHRWVQTTAAAVCELSFSRRGKYADHYFGKDAEGFTGWHSICGGLLPSGESTDLARLPEWWQQSSPLPALAESLSDSITEEAAPHGIKIYFGLDDLAEVRLNGEVHEAASETLRSLNWPRVRATLRTYLILIHRDCKCT